MIKVYHSKYDKGYGVFEKAHVFRVIRFCLIEMGYCLILFILQNNNSGYNKFDLEVKTNFLKSTHTHTLSYLDLFYLYYRIPIPDLDVVIVQKVILEMV